MEDVEASRDKPMRLRYAGTCRVCSVALERGAEAVYERDTKTVRCRVCSPSSALSPAPGAAHEWFPSPVDPGVPGASARREFERRRARREDEIRAKHRRLGGLIVALSEDPQSTRAWDTGALGEERLGARLSELAGESLRVLHDRQIPGSRANIDHLVVTPRGVFVIDAKRYRGRPSLVVEGGIVRPRVEKVMVAGRDRSKLVDGVRKQVEAVRGLVGDGVEVHGVLCFVEADFPLIGGAFATRGVEIIWPKKLYRRLQEAGSMSTSGIAQVHQDLARGLLPAA